MYLIFKNTLTLGQYNGRVWQGSMFSVQTTDEYLIPK